MSRQDVLNKAQSQDGTAESPPNSNKSIYGLWYEPSLNGQKWCAMFVSWVFDHAGHPLGHIQTKNGIHHARRDGFRRRNANAPYRCLWLELYDSCPRTES